MTSGDTFSNEFLIRRRSRVA